MRGARRAHLHSAETEESAQALQSWRQGGGAEWRLTASWAHGFLAGTTATLWGRQRDGHLVLSVDAHLLENWSISKTSLVLWISMFKKLERENMERDEQMN